MYSASGAEKAETHALTPTRSLTLSTHGQSVKTPAVHIPSTHTPPRHTAAPTGSITAMQPQTSHTCNLSRIILHAPTPSPVALCCRTAICASAHAQCQCNVRRKPASLAKLRRLPPHHARCWDGAYLARRRVAAAIANHRLVGMIAPHKCGCADRLSCVAQLAHACILFFSRIHIGVLVSHLLNRLRLVDRFQDVLGTVLVIMARLPLQAGHCQLARRRQLWRSSDVATAPFSEVPSFLFRQRFVQTPLRPSPTDRPTRSGFSPAPLGPAGDRQRHKS